MPLPLYNLGQNVMALIRYSWHMPPLNTLILSIPRAQPHRPLVNALVMLQYPITLMR